MPNICKSCPAVVRFVRNNVSGKWQILDKDPSPRGNIRLLGEKSIVAEVLGTGQAEEARAAGESLYVDHHVTCPKRDEWRGRRQ